MLVTLKAVGLVMLRPGRHPCNYKANNAIALVCLATISRRVTNPKASLNSCILQLFLKFIDKKRQQLDQREEARKVSALVPFCLRSPPPQLASFTILHALRPRLIYRVACGNKPVTKHVQTQIVHYFTSCV